MMSTTDPRPALQQTSYNLEVPFAILDVRHGVWADVIEEVEREHSVNFGRHRNQFQKTILTVHASDDAQFEAAAEALREAHGRVHEERIPIPNQDAKTRIIGRNGVRMDSVSRKFGVSVRYCEAELMAYIQGASKQMVSAAATRLNAFEEQVKLSDKQNGYLRAHDSTIDAIERKWKVKISSIPNVSWKQSTQDGASKKSPSIYVVVGGRTPSLVPRVISKMLPFMLMLTWLLGR